MPLTKEELRIYHREHYARTRSKKAREQQVRRLLEAQQIVNVETTSLPIVEEVVQKDELITKEVVEVETMSRSDSSDLDYDTLYINTEEYNDFVKWKGSFKDSTNTKNWSSLVKYGLMLGGVLVKTYLSLPQERQQKTVPETMTDEERIKNVFSYNQPTF